MSTTHRYGEGYSGRNPVPTVGGFQQQQAERHAAESPLDDADIDKDLPPKPAPTPAAEKPDQLGALSPSTNNKTTSTDKSVSNTQMSSPNSSTVHALAGSLSKQQKQTDGPGPESKAEIMEKANASKIKPTDRLKKNQGDRTVKDPVTGQDVIVRDANLSCEFILYPHLLLSVFTSLAAYDSDALDPSHPKPGPADQAADIA